MRNWDRYILVASLLALMNFAFNSVASAAEPATGPEDVPKLGKEDVGGEAEEKNRPPTISIGWSPHSPVIGHYVGTSQETGEPIILTTTVIGNDPDGGKLTYTIDTNAPGPGNQTVRLDAGSKLVDELVSGGKSTILRIHARVEDEQGASAEKTVYIPLLDPYDDARNKELEWQADWLSKDWKAPEWLVERKGAPVEELKEIDGRFLRRREDREAATDAASVVDGPAPWRNPGVEQCVRRYLQQVALPAEQRLTPGRFTHVDDWGRFLGPHLNASGPVEGVWDNPTHFVWSQYGSERATQRYGVSLRNYVVDCLGGGASGPEIATAPPATEGLSPGLVTGPEAREAFEALRRKNKVTFSDFENVSTGPHKSLKLGDIRVTLRTTEIRYPLPPKSAPTGAPVVVLPHGFLKSPTDHRLIGVAAGNAPDGQSEYELILSKPVSHVGLMRNWNTDSLTRFYNEAGTLLAEYRNKSNREFVGYVADRLENYVYRIQIDGLPSEPASASNKAYQVGEVDDLYIGILPTSGPAPKQIGTTAAHAQQVVDLYNEAKSAIQEGNKRFRSRDTSGSQKSYQRALKALQRAEQADIAGQYAQTLADGIALVERNLARIAAQAEPSQEQREKSLSRTGKCMKFVGVQRVKTGTHEFGTLAERVNVNENPNKLVQKFDSPRGYSGAVEMTWTKPPAVICDGDEFNFEVVVNNLQPFDGDPGGAAGIVAFAPTGPAQISMSCSNPSVSDPKSRVTVAMHQVGASNRCTAKIRVNLTSPATIFVASLQAGPYLGVVHYRYAPQ